MAAGNLLRLGADRALYLGALPTTGWLAMLSLYCLVGAGVEHIFDSQGERVASIFLEPDAPEVCSLHQQFLQAESVAFGSCQDQWERRLVAFDGETLLKYPCLWAIPQPWIRVSP